MTIKVQLSGEPDEITAMVQHLAEAFDVAGGDRSYPNHGSFGVRVYLEVRARTDQETRHVNSERVHPPRAARPTRGEIQP